MDDSSFIYGIQFLIKNDIIQVPTDTLDYVKENSVKIPFWVKNNADWWSKGLISDGEFKKVIQYLIQNGVIEIETMI
jgi:hypothetical protein